MSPEYSTLIISYRLNGKLNCDVPLVLYHFTIYIRNVSNFLFAQRVSLWRHDRGQFLMVEFSVYFLRPARVIHALQLHLINNHRTVRTLLARSRGSGRKFLTASVKRWPRAKGEMERTTRYCRLPFFRLLQPAR